LKIFKKQSEKLSENLSQCNHLKEEMEVMKGRERE